MLLYDLFRSYFGNLRLERLAIFPLSGAGHYCPLKKDKVKN